MKTAILAAAALAASLSAASARDCMVSDPTGTPLNFRSAPNGEVLGTLRNGTFVRIIGQTRDSRGRAWAQVATEGFRYDIWVFREFISCR
jgi:uncharacterized protein YraI